MGAAGEQQRGHRCGGNTAWLPLRSTTLLSSRGVQELALQHGLFLGCCAPSLPACAAGAAAGKGSPQAAAEGCCSQRHGCTRACSLLPALPSRCPSWCRRSPVTQLSQGWAQRSKHHPRLALRVTSMRYEYAALGNGRSGAGMVSPQCQVRSWGSLHALVNE